MDKLLEILLKATPAMLKSGLAVADRLTAKYLTIEEETHHRIVGNFLTHLNGPRILYARSELSVAGAIQAAVAFFARRGGPHFQKTTRDEWTIMGAFRKEPGLKEQLFHPFDVAGLAKHYFLFAIGPADAGSHVYAGCRYTDDKQINFRDRFGKAAAERAYEAAVAVRVTAPLVWVTVDNVASLP